MENAEPEMGFVERYVSDAFARATGGVPDRAGMREIQSRYGLDMDPASVAALIERYGVRLPRM